MRRGGAVARPAWVKPQGEAAGIGQPFRLRTEPAQNRDRVAQPQHAVEFRRRKIGVGRRGIDDWAAVGGKEPQTAPNPRQNYRFLQLDYFADR